MAPISSIKTLFLYTGWPKLSAEILPKVTNFKNKHLIPIYSMGSPRVHNIAWLQKSQETPRISQGRPPCPGDEELHHQFTRGKNTFSRGRGPPPCHHRHHHHLTKPPFAIEELISTPARGFTCSSSSSSSSSSTTEDS